MTVLLSTQNICFGWKIRKYLQLYWQTFNFNSFRHCLLVPSADNFGKQFGPRSGPKKCRAWSGSNLFDTQMVLLPLIFRKNCSKKMILKKISRSQKSMKNFPGGKELILTWNFLETWNSASGIIPLDCSVEEYQSVATCNQFDSWTKCGKTARRKL